MTRFDAIGFGALNVDRLFSVNRIASAEEESVIIGHEESCGGSAANTMVALARLGCKVSVIGKVGADKDGRMLLESFCEEGVDTTMVIRARHGRSGTAMGFVDRRGQRALYIDPGVNDEIEPGELSVKLASRTKFLHLTSFVGEKSLQVQQKLLNALPEKVRVSFDPGIIYARHGLEKLEPIIKRAFVVMPNAIELRLLTGKADYRKGTESLLHDGVSLVAVKLGAKGCYVSDGKEKHLIRAYRVRAVDTTGAGDAFSAGFLYGLIKNKTILNCGKIGNLVASRCIIRVGARAGLPRVEDLGPLA
jgi:ribokinase